MTRSHLLHRLLRLLEQLRRVNQTEADVDTGRIVNRVGASLDDGRGEGSGSGFEDEVEGVIGVELKTREFGGGVVERVGDGREALAVAVHGERYEGGGGEFELVPFEGDLSVKECEKEGKKGRKERKLTLV
jgi:hypothetical protein